MSCFVRPALLGLCLLGLTVPLFAQSDTTTRDPISHMIRVYEDDDFINIWSVVSDDSYTNGTRIDYFYHPEHPSHFFPDKWMPAAGDSAIDIYGWGAMQLMYTPDSITDAGYQPNDYPWSGALFATHTRYSYNPVKHYDLQTELVLGVIGPLALDKQTQSLAHKIGDFQTPRGWGNQFANDLLLNVNFTAETQLTTLGSFVTIIGGAQVYAGTMQNGAALYPMILIGKMNPYFQGFLRQNSSAEHINGHQQWQLYFFAKPELQWFASNAMLQGGPFIHNPTYHPLQNWLPTFTYGMNLSCGRWGFSGSQIISPAMLRGLYCHNYGNVSLFYSW